MVAPLLQDSETSWMLCERLRRLSDAEDELLCTGR